jgi:hypothetical protein
MKKINVLIFPCGSENAGEIYQALRYSPHIGLLLGASSVSDHGEFRFDNYVGDVPNISEVEFAERFNQIVSEFAIDVVFATHDSVALRLGELNSDGAYFLVNGNAQTARVLRHKSATYDLFADCDWVPARYRNAVDVCSWPVIVKPDCGQGGNGVQLVDNEKELADMLQSLTDVIAVEYLPGEEITVDCFTDRNRKLIWVGPRSRERVRAGISMRSRSLEMDSSIREIVNIINRRLVLRGPWFVQLKRDGVGKWKLLEASCRVAGAMVFQRARGVNLPLMALHDFMERDLSTLPVISVNMVDRCIITRARSSVQFERVYVDLDETLIIDGEAVPVVIAFLYQCRRQGIPLVLITRHAALPRETLAKAAISSSLFEEIIHLTGREKKSDFISPHSLFIDNYFPERQDVSQLPDVVVIDTDAVEFFLR